MGKRGGRKNEVEEAEVEMEPVRSLHSAYYTTAKPFPTKLCNLLLRQNVQWSEKSKTRAARTTPIVFITATTAPITTTQCHLSVYSVLLVVSVLFRTSFFSENCY